MADIEGALRNLTESDEDIAEIVEYILSAFPTYEQALGAMGYHDLQGPQSADSSHVRLKVESVTTARVT